MFNVRTLWNKIIRLARSSKSALSQAGFQQTFSLESLEDRRLLSVSPSQIKLSSSNLYITGSDAADTVTVSEATGGMINVRLESGGESLSLDFTKSQVQTIYFFGKLGDDQFSNSTDIATRAYGDQGNDTLTGGTGVDDLRGGDGDDILEGREGNDRFSGDAGNDVLSGGAGDDSISGGDGDDILVGGDGNDLLSGNEGQDLLNGNIGDDRLLGDGGSDTLYGDEGVDVLRGGEGDDTLRGGAGDDNFDGEGGNDSLLGEAGDDSLSGGDGDDAIDGGDGNDTLSGGIGNDVLSGRLGNDRLLGDTGLDTLYGDEGLDELRGGEGDDTLRGGAGDDNFDGEGGNDRLFGDAGNDSVAGGDGNDTIEGGDGHDLLAGNAGNDLLSGGIGNDTLYGDVGNDRLLGEAGDDSIFGGDDDDSLNGGDGNDILSGGIGNDVLVGKLGNDRLQGDAGLDLLYGDEGLDELRGGDGDDILRGGVGNDMLDGDGGKDRLLGEAGDDSLSGGDGDDKIDGGDGNDLLSGGVGNDVLTGKLGNDRLLGDAGSDLLYGDEGMDELRGGDGDDILRGGASIDWLYGDGGNDRLLGEAGNDSLSGDDGDDAIDGGDDNDLLSGGIGNDVLVGMLGNDRLLGDGGSDTLYGDEGVDELRGGEGNDTLRGGIGNDLLYGEEGGDRLFGEAGDDSLSGGDGDDVIVGSDGNDVLSGGEGQDLLNGNTGDDRLYGDAGLDLLYGDEGVDELRGGEDDDTMLGGEGNDTLSGEGGNDRIFGEAGDDSISGGTGDDVLSGGDADDTVRGGEGNDLLSGDIGDDALEAEEGADVLIGGDGIDTLSGGAGEDLLIGGRVSHDLATLDLLLAQWSSGATYESRIASIEDELFEAHLQSEETVLDDYVADSIYGGVDRDWLFVTGAASVYDPNMANEHHRGQQAHSAGHDGAHVIDDIPVVEGFDLIDALDKLEDKAANESVHTIVPHADDASKRREHLSLFELVRYDQITHYAVSSGNWSDSSTWHDGVVPAANARVLIPIGVEVTVDRLLAPEIATIRVDGTLSFATQVNTWLKVDTIIVTDVGSLEMGTAADPIAANVTARLTFTNNGAIDRNWDPFGISRGLITHGSVEMHGAEVTSSAELAGPVFAGTTLLLPSSPTVGWRVGDKIVIAGTEGTNQSEERIIRAIIGDFVVVDPLQYNHLTLSPVQALHVANLTRNVVIDSEGTAVERRGHVMFMHNKDVNIDYAGFYKLGRTNKLEVINDPVVDANWNLVPGTGTNPRARYSVHFHRNGTTITGDPATINGSVVEDNPGWGYVNHSSYVDFTNNVAYNITGAGFAAEVGDEVGSFRENIAINIKASGDDIESRLAVQDFGFTGDGFWFQSAGVTVVDNVVANAEGHAFIYYTRGLELGGDKPQFLASNLVDPSIANGASGIATDHVPVREFKGNVGYASGTGLAVWYNLRDAGHDAESVFGDSKFWNNETGADLKYSFKSVLRDVAFVHDLSSMPSLAVTSNSVSKDLTFDNITISGYYIGIEAARRGYTIIDGGAFATRIGVSVRSPSEPGRVVTVQGSFAMVPLPSEVLDNWVQMDVGVRFDVTPVHESIDHVFYDSKVILNYGPYQNRQLYSPMQSANAVLFPNAGAYIPGEFVGLTTIQIKLLYGKTVLGEIVPANALTLPTLGGLLKP